MKINFDSISTRLPTMTLYHYTSPSGLIGIVGKKCIWSTDIRYLNDTKEFQHAIDITKEVINGALRMDPEDIPVNKVEYDLLDHIQRNIWKYKGHQVYVTSFSEEGDLLSQWRGYCHDGGYALGFRFDVLRVWAETRGFVLVSCIYDEKEKKRLIHNLLVRYNKIFKRIRTLFKNIEHDQKVHLVASRFFLNLLYIAPLFKDESFKEEREWRLISSNMKGAPDLKFRAGKSTIVPYIELEFDREIHDLIWKVVCGPNQHPELARIAVSDLIGRIADGRLINSKIPYRNI